MDIETRLQTLESDLHRTKRQVATLRLIMVAFLILILPRVSDSREWIFIMVVLAVYLLVSAALGFWRFYTQRARLHEKIMTEFIGERAKIQDQNHP